MEYAALLRELERRRVPPVALLHGAEPLLLDDVLGLVSRALFGEAAAAPFDREVMDARETSAETIARSAQTLPFLAPRRLVAVRHADALAARGAETLQQYLATPSPSTCLLLLAAESLRADRTRKADHWLLGAVPAEAVVEVSARRGGALERMLQQRAAVDGLEVGAEAARLLVQLVGDDLGLLLGEAAKAALAGGPDNRRVGVAEVTAVVGAHRIGELFDLLRAVEAGERGRALALLDQLLRAGEEPLRILGLLVSDLRTAREVKEWLRRGLGADQVARRLRRPPAVVERIVSRAAGVGVGDLAERLERCWQVERRIKSGGEPRAEMAVLIADLC